MEAHVDAIFEETIDFMRQELGMRKIDPRSCSSLSLALVGDAVYDLAARCLVLSRGDKAVNKLHREKSFYVRAKSQAQAADALSEVLTEEEMAVFKRGRNTKSHTSAKNAEIQEYRKSTGFEALIGYLFLSGQYVRMTEIIKFSLGMHYES